MISSSGTLGAVRMPTITQSKTLKPPLGKGATREAAGLFYYLNRTGFNGLCRFNRTGQFNVPFGRYARIAYTRDFTQYRDVLAGWTFANTDVEAVQVEEGDFVYADPPHDVEFTQYARAGFTWEDQERTAACLAKHHGPVVLVNQATPRIERLYRQLRFTVQFLLDSSPVDKKRRLARPWSNSAHPSGSRASTAS